MGSFVDIVMLILFVVFMVFIQRGYHHNKALEREKLKKLDEQKEEESKKL